MRLRAARGTASIGDAAELPAADTARGSSPQPARGDTAPTERTVSYHAWHLIGIRTGMYIKSQLARSAADMETWINLVRIRSQKLGTQIHGPRKCKSACAQKTVMPMVIESSSPGMKISFEPYLFTESNTDARPMATGDIRGRYLFRQVVVV